MKTFITIILLVCVLCYKAKAQTDFDFLRKSKAFITQAMGKLNKMKLIQSVELDYGKYQIAYVNQENLEAYNYILKEDSCVLYQRRYVIVNLNDVIRELNQNNIHIKTDEWTTKDYGEQIKLLFYDADKVNFYISHTALD